MRDSAPSSTAPQARGRAWCARSRPPPCRASRASRKRTDSALPFAGDAAVLDALVAQRGADVVGRRLHLLGERRLHVHLQQEMHAAAQIEPEVHRQRADRRQPARAVGQQVQRDDVVLAELRLQQVLRLQLRVGVREAHLDAVGVEKDAVRRDMPPFLSVSSTRASSAVSDLSVALHRRDLHRRHLAEEVGQRVDEAPARSVTPMRMYFQRG